MDAKIRSMYANPSPSPRLRTGDAKPLAEFKDYLGCQLLWVHPNLVVPSFCRTESTTWAHASPKSIIIAAAVPSVSALAPPPSLKNFNTKDCSVD